MFCYLAEEQFAMLGLTDENLLRKLKKLAKCSEGEAKVTTQIYKRCGINLICESLWLNLLWASGKIGRMP